MARQLSYGATIRRETIAEFCNKWPCHGIDTRVWCVWCRWDGDGNLAELLVTFRNGKECAPELYDGEAMTALINDTQRQMRPEHAR